MSALLTADDEAAALEQLHELGCTDGLPVVVPTPERVERMVLAVGYPAETALGEMGPLQGVCTVEKLAAAAVMAGCLPDYMPIVVASALAMMDPAFDLAEMQGTTHATAPLIIVNGPARAMCGVASGYGALGPGHRANASIGRAIRLAMINIGGARPGTPTWPCLVTAASSASASGRTKRTARSHRSTRVEASPPRTRPSRLSARSRHSRWRTLPEVTSSARANVSLASWLHRSPASVRTTPGWAAGRP